MNSRDYKIFRSGCYYHAYNRGNNKNLIFCCESDYTAFLIRLKLALGKHMSKGIFDSTRIRITPFEPGEFKVLAYCLMPNHFHFLIRQDTEVGIDKLIHRVCTSYAKYYNLKHERIGNLFQDSFKAKLVDSDSYVKYVSAYIHNNPEQPFSYLYSSLPDYVGKRNGTICNTDVLLEMFNNNRAEYQTFVSTYGPKERLLTQNYIFEDED